MILVQSDFDINLVAKLLINTVVVEGKEILSTGQTICICHDCLVYMVCVCGAIWIKKTCRKLNSILRLDADEIFPVIYRDESTAFFILVQKSNEAGLVNVRTDKW
jgi:hypothetical protein